MALKMGALKAFTMPKWGIEMVEGLVASWGAQEGTDFARGTVLALVETDKITNEIEAEADGRLVRIVAREGETHPVGALLAVFGDASATPAEIDAFVAHFQPAGAVTDADDTPDPARAQAPEPVPEPVIPDTAIISPVARERVISNGLSAAKLAGTGRGGRITAQDVDQATRPIPALALRGPYAPIADSPAFASPSARRMAAEHGVDLANLPGTGPRGRISKADVLAAAKPTAPIPVEATAAVPPFVDADTSPTVGIEILKMSPIRKVIARRLTEAKQTIPHFYVRRRVRADRLLALRAAASTPRPSVNDYLIRACALALMEVPQLNIQVHGHEIHRFAAADIAVAVSTEKGLVTPIVAAADSLGVTEIATRMGALAARARAGKLQPDEYSGGSFSISNLGGFGVEQFDAIINPPQGAILAVGTARPEPIDDDGAIRIARVLHLSLSCDHRAIDGADGGRFLAALAELIEHPERLI